MLERYVMFMDEEGHDLLVGCQECDEPLFTIDLTEGPDVPIGDLLREHEREKHAIQKETAKSHR